MRTRLMGQPVKRNGGQARSERQRAERNGRTLCHPPRPPFVLTKRCHPFCPERNGMSQPYVRTVPGTLPPSPAAASFDKSHNRLAGSARRLVIEATFTL